MFTCLLRTMDFFIENIACILILFSRLLSINCDSSKVILTVNTTSIPPGNQSSNSTIPATSIQPSFIIGTTNQTLPYTKHTQSVLQSMQVLNGSVTSYVSSIDSTTPPLNATNVPSVVYSSNSIAKSSNRILHRISRTINSLSVSINQGNHISYISVSFRSGQMPSQNISNSVSSTSNTILNTVSKVASTLTYPSSGIISPYSVKNSSFGPLVVSTIVPTQSSLFTQTSRSRNNTAKQAPTAHSTSNASVMPTFATYSKLNATVMLTSATHSNGNAAAMVTSSLHLNGNVTSTPGTHSNIGHCSAIGCCTYGLNQLPLNIQFKESDTAGFVLTEMKGLDNVTFNVRVTRPSALTSLLDGYFNVSVTGQVYSLVLTKEIDLEDLYMKTSGNKDVHSFQLMVSCFESGLQQPLVPPFFVNVNVEDIDDCMPVFQHQSTDSDCVVPVYNADTSEDYMGELKVSPGKIQAVDGDLTSQHNVTYRVMHAEPNDYSDYFEVDVIEGTVNKTRLMNASEQNRYVLFIEAKEESPQQKKRVAVLSIAVFAPPNALGDDPIVVDSTAKLSLQVLSALVLIGFVAGFVIIVHYRHRVNRQQIESGVDDVVRDLKLPKLAVYKSSSSSLGSTIPDVPVITSPSHIVVKPAPVKPSTRKTSITIRKPLDTKLRPGWNVSSPKPRRYTYSPYIKKA